MKRHPADQGRSQEYTHAARAPSRSRPLEAPQQTLGSTATHSHEKHQLLSGPIDYSDEDRYDSDESDDKTISEDLNEEEAARAVEELLGKYTTLFQQLQHAEEGQHVEQASTAAGADEKSQESWRSWLFT